MNSTMIALMVEHNMVKVWPQVATPGQKWSKMVTPSDLVKLFIVEVTE